MQTASLAWNAPIIPGKSMLGLTLGMSFEQVLQLLKQKRISSSATNEGSFAIQLNGESILQVEVQERRKGITLRDPSSIDPVTGIFDEVFQLGFLDEKLVRLLALQKYGSKAATYKGALLEKIQIGSKVSELMQCMDFEYDSADELLYPTDPIYGGLAIGGLSAPPEDDPDQIISYIRIDLPPAEQPGD